MGQTFQNFKNYYENIIFKIINPSLKICPLQNLWFLMVCTKCVFQLLDRIKTLFVKKILTLFAAFALVLFVVISTFALVLILADFCKYKVPNVLDTKIIDNWWYIILFTGISINYRWYSYPTDFVIFCLNKRISKTLDLVMLLLSKMTHPEKNKWYACWHKIMSWATLEANQREEHAK